MKATRWNEAENGRTAIDAESLLTADRLVAEVKNATCSASDLWTRTLINIVILARGDAPKNVSDDTVATILGSQDVKQKRFVALGVIRLLQERSMHALMEPPLRQPVMALFDTFFDGLYEPFQIDRRTQAHEKLRTIQSKIAACEARYRASVTSLTSLDRLDAHRQDVLRTLGQEASRILICPFLPEKIIAELSELYLRIENYCKARDSLRVMEAYKEASRAIMGFIEQCEAFGTLYASWLAEHVGRAAKSIVDNSFSTTAAAQPADITIIPRQRKYPLHLVDHRFELVVEIRNRGSGYATELEVGLDAPCGFQPAEGWPSRIQKLAPGESLTILFSALVTEPVGKIETLIIAKWSDIETFNIQKERVEYLVAEAQRSDINWEELSNPYTLEPVANERELIGRGDLMRTLVATISERSVGSASIRGQKRVGKTSIAKAITSHFRERGDVVIDINHYNAADASRTINQLGGAICRKVRRFKAPDGTAIFSDLEAPAFDGELSPLGMFLEDAIELLGESRRLLIVLDEFDQLPLDLFTVGPTSRAFFLALRNISSIQQVGIVLVGGEKMLFILDEHGMQLNKFIHQPVDYFNQCDDDYQALVKAPAADVLEYTPSAILNLHHVTAGNPYFTKELCRRIFTTAVRKRDCYVSEQDVAEAIVDAVTHLDAAPFCHFWRDSIFTTDKEREKEIVEQRERVLIALAQNSSHNQPVAVADIAENLPEQVRRYVERDLQDFATRRVLVPHEMERAQPGEARYNFKMPLLGQWLKEHGAQDVVQTFSTLDQDKDDVERLRVKTSEIKSLIDKWGGHYKYREITTHAVHDWLCQFGTDPKQHRALFKVLQATRFYTYAYVQDKLQEIDRDYVRQGLLNRREDRQRKHSDVLVSYLDSPAKSGSEMANLYADVNCIYSSNVVEQEKIGDALEGTSNIRALVFIDDFVGTGKSAVANLRSMDARIGTILKARRIKVVFVAVVAYKEGWLKVEQAADEVSMDARSCEILTEADCLFSSTSKAFDSDAQKLLARELAMEHGKALTQQMKGDKITPLGFGDAGLAIVFERNCPNNSLPILWAEPANGTWTPLFKR